MTAFLVFTVCAPHGAWGAASQSSATMAYKATELDPSQSALIGLIGAALGLERSRLGELAAALRLSVRVGVRPERDPRPDYQTVTRGAPPPGRSHWSRFEEVRGFLAGTVSEGSLLSRREYWTAGLWTVAVERREDGDWPLETLRAALAAPRWSLHAGRKGCPLGLPPDPELIEADSPRAALAAYRLPWERKPALVQALEPLWRDRDEGDLLLDGDPGTPPADAAGPVRLERRRDRPDPMVLADGRSLPRHRERIQARMPWRREGEETR